MTDSDPDPDGPARHVAPPIRRTVAESARDFREFQERRRGRHAELRALIEREVGREPWPGLVVSRRNTRWNQSWGTPPSDLAYGAVGVLLGAFMIFWAPILNSEFPPEVGMALGLPIALIGLVGIARAIVRFRWWRGARRVALMYQTLTGTELPDDLRPY